MRKAVITGFITGIIISAVLICASYVRLWLPETFTANLFFITLFFFSMVGVLWLSLNHYCKTSEVKWMTLSVTGAVSSIIAAVVVTLFSGPLGYSVYDFLDLAIMLFLISVFITAVYYARNRNRVQEHVTSKNPELIF